MGEQAPPLAPYERHVFFCTGPRCAPETCQDVYQALKSKLRALKVDQKSVRRAQVHCFDICQSGPIMVVYPEAIWYHHVTLDKIDRIIEEHLLGGKPVLEWTFKPSKKAV